MWKHNFSWRNYTTRWILWSFCRSVHKSFVVVYEVQKNVDVNIGDRVITSGFSQIYPPKLPVGTVSGVYDERGSYQKVINVNIQNDFESIQNVFIVVGDKWFSLSIYLSC